MKRQTYLIVIILMVGVVTPATLVLLHVSLRERSVKTQALPIGTWYATERRVLSDGSTMLVEYVYKLDGSQRWDLWYFYDGGASWSKGSWTIENNHIHFYSELPEKLHYLDRLLGKNGISHLESAEPDSKWEIVNYGGKTLQVKELGGSLMTFRPHRGERGDDIRSMVAD